MTSVAILFAFIGVCVALPMSQEDIPDFQNVIAVPPNCPQNQQLINGQCRDIWTWRNNPSAADLGVIDPSLWFSGRNVITVPPNCPPGQQLINGVCRDVWRRFILTTSPPKIFKYWDVEQRDTSEVQDEINEGDTFQLLSQMDRNIINIPNQCPVGYRPDPFGICRRIIM